MTQHAAHYLAQLLAGASLTQAVSAAAELGIADALADGERTGVELAPALGCDGAALARLLRVLRALGIVVEKAPDRWALAPAGRLLRGDVPGSMRAAARLAGAPWRAAALDLAECVRRGESMFTRRFGAPLYRWFEEHPGQGADFDAVQEGSAAALDPALFGLERATRVLDVGGGTGALLGRLLERAPHLRGVLVERPCTAALAREQLAARGLADRVEVVAGDLFAPLPEGADLVVLGFVLHNWDDDRAAALLDRCAQATAPGVRLVLVENLRTVTPDASIALLDLEMLLFHEGGRERTEAEYRVLLERAGFSLRAVHPTASTARILESERLATSPIAIPIGSARTP